MEPTVLTPEEQLQKIKVLNQKLKEADQKLEEIRKEKQDQEPLLKLASLLSGKSVSDIKRELLVKNLPEKSRFQILASPLNLSQEQVDKAYENFQNREVLGSVIEQLKNKDNELDFDDLIVALSKHN